MSVLLGGRQEFSLVINLSFCNGILKILFMVDARLSASSLDSETKEGDGTTLIFYFLFLW